MLKPAEFCVHPSPAFRPVPPSAGARHDAARRNRRELALHGAADTYGKISLAVSDPRAVEFSFLQSAVQFSCHILDYFTEAGLVGNGYQPTSYRVGLCPTTVGQEMLEPFAAPLAPAELLLREPWPPARYLTYRH